MATLVDLRGVVTDAVGDARVAGPEHVWSLDAPRAPAVVGGDEARLTQVMLNLLANARAHTRPAPASTSGSPWYPARTGPTTGDHSGDHSGDHVVLTVTDDGPGMPPEVAAEAFERCTRGDSSRSRAAGSTGLGLAIVDAVVRAHGGDVTLRAGPAGGTTVTVRVPVAVPAADPAAATDDSPNDDPAPDHAPDHAPDPAAPATASH